MGLTLGTACDQPAEKEETQELKVGFALQDAELCCFFDVPKPECAGTQGHRFCGLDSLQASFANA